MNCLFKLSGYKHHGEATELRLLVPRDEGDRIISLASSGRLTGQITLDDGRQITAKQKQRISRNIKDISEHTGYGFYECMIWLLYDFNILSSSNYQHFEHMSVGTAREFIEYLLEFIFRFDVSLTESLMMRTDNAEYALKLCLKYRRCAITGQHADIHHCTGSRIGMGHNRQTISNIGRKIIALSREWHNKVHDEGEVEIFEKYRIHGVALTIKELIDYGISTAEIT